MAFKLPKPTLEPIEPCAFRDRKFHAPYRTPYAIGDPVRASYIGDRSKYHPHQGAAECERRANQNRRSKP